MAEMNVLAGGQDVLKMIISEVNEQNGRIERFNKTEDDIQELKKNIEAVNKSVQDAIDARIKESTEAVSSSYDKMIAANEDKIKNIQSKRGKAKVAGVKERIANETASLRRENKELSESISERFKSEKIPGFCSSRLYHILFRPKGVVDVLFYSLMLIVLYLALPIIISYIPKVSVFVIIGYYFALIVLQNIVFKVIYNKTLLDHVDAIDESRRIKNTIKSNRKKMKTIEKNIRSDRNETMYGLEGFDSKIEALNQDIKNIESQKSNALLEFENTVKVDIINEMHNASKEKIDALNDNLQALWAEHNELDAVIKDKRTYISSNFEAYLGKDIFDIEKLNKMLEIMQSGEAETISQALTVYSDKTIK